MFFEKSENTETNKEENKANICSHYQRGLRLVCQCVCLQIFSAYSHVLFTRMGSDETSSYHQPVPLSPTVEVARGTYLRLFGAVNIRLSEHRTVRNRTLGSNGSTLTGHGHRG